MCDIKRIKRYFWNSNSDTQIH